MDECQDIRAIIEETIMEDPPISIKEGGLIRLGYDEKLDELREIQKNGRHWITQLDRVKE